MQDLNHKLATMSTNRETLERLCYTMRDEISEVSNKVDNQSLEIKDCQGALRVQSKMFESQATKMVLVSQNHYVSKTYECEWIKCQIISLVIYIYDWRSLLFLRIRFPDEIISVDALFLLTDSSKTQKLSYVFFVVCFVHLELPLT